MTAATAQGAIPATGTLRAEVVGSLLRPPELLDARRRHQAGELDDASFKRIEDRAVLEAIRLQEEVGVDVLSDGEYRRAGWATHFFESVEGLKNVGGTVLPWRDEAGNPLPEGAPARARPVVMGKLRARHSACTEEWTFLRGHTDRPAKVTLVSAEMAAALYDPELSREAYPTRDDYFADVIEVLRGEVAEVARLGCTYVQLDAPQYGALVDPEMRERFRRRGDDPDRMIDAGVEMDNAIMDGFPGVTFGLHICRGNNQSRFYAEGDYEPVTRIFERSSFDRFLLEYDDERSGGFSPLRAVPDDRVIVLGLLTTKRPDLESAAELKNRIEEAGRYISRERLALSPQCGFASVAEGNQLSFDDQRAKLELVVEVARSVWG
jgi:5-methyltetrahydropteroyltriglutamate--homocysteine methyltransferase